MNEVSLKLDGKLLLGWTAVRVSRGIDRIAGAFDLQLTELEPDDPLRRDIRVGTSCVVRIDDESMISGFVEDLRVSYSGERHAVAVAGRDATGDLVDCSADRDPGEWNNQTIEQITRDLVAPFEGIDLQSDADTRPAFPQFRIRRGETVFETISRAAAMRNLLPVSDGDGTLRFIRPGDDLAPTAIAPARAGPGGVLSGSITSSNRQRFSRYRALMQVQPSSNTLVQDQPNIEAIASDQAVARYRPKVLLGPFQGDGAGLQSRVDMEAGTRAARSRIVRYQVQGWRTASGWLWRPGYRVPVFDPLLAVGTSSGAPRELLISNVQFAVSDQVGAVTELELVAKEAFTVEPVPSENGHWRDEGSALAAES